MELTTSPTNSSSPRVPPPSTKWTRYRPSAVNRRPIFLSRRGLLRFCHLGRHCRRTSLALGLARTLRNLLETRGIRMANRGPGPCGVAMVHLRVAVLQATRIDQPLLVLVAYPTERNAFKMQQIRNTVVALVLARPLPGMRKPRGV